MAIFTQLLSVLGDGDEITITLKKVKQESSVLLIPKIATHDPDVKDENILQLQAALSRPLFINLPSGEDPEKVLEEVVSEMKAAREPALNALDSYRQELDAAATSAKKAKETEAAKKAAAPATKVVKKKVAKPKQATKTVKEKAPPKAKKAKAEKKAKSTADKKSSHKVMPTATPPEAPMDLFSGQTQ